MNSGWQIFSEKNKNQRTWDNYIILYISSWWKEAKEVDWVTHGSFNEERVKYLQDPLKFEMLAKG